MVLIQNGHLLSAELSLDDGFFHLEGNCHWDIIRQLLGHADHALLVAPYLFGSFAELFQGLPRKQRTLALITSCARKGAEQLDKPPALRAFGNAARDLTGHWPSISLDENLHSKVYAFYRSGRPFAAIVTSANLTHPGLKTQHETGLITTDAELINDAVNRAMFHREYVDLSEHAVDQLCAWVEVAGRDVSRPAAVDIGLADQIRKHCTPSADHPELGRQQFERFFLKVSGYGEKPILPENREPWDTPYGKVTFARSPREIGPGDCLIEVAVGGKCFLSYYACASTVSEASQAERKADSETDRWPYFVWANNLSLHYARHWYERPLYYDEVVDRFHAAHPGEAVTLNGASHFKGAVQQHHSYVKLTPSFGRFAVDSIRAWRRNASNSEEDPQPETAA